MTARMAPGEHVGVRGEDFAVVDRAGAVHRHGFASALQWWVAASDRWHDPQREPTVRQRRIEGTPVVETKLAVPGGDVVQRVFAVPDAAGMVVMHVRNQSPEAVALAVCSQGISTTAATAGTKAAGLDAPDDVRAYPLAHGSEIVCAWSVRRPRWRQRRLVVDAAALPSHEQVVRGWVQASEMASRWSHDSEHMVAARSRVLMATAHEIDDLLADHPVLGVLAVGERVRMGDPALQWVLPTADALQRIARELHETPTRLQRHRRQRSGSETFFAKRALAVGAQVMQDADEPSAYDDLLAWWQQPTVEGVDAQAPVVGTVDTDALTDAVIFAARGEDRLARAVSTNLVHVLPTGLPDGWRGLNMDAHGLFAGPGRRVSLALRWHGPNVALLWEHDGPADVSIRAPLVDASFGSHAPSGEALLRVGQ